jgi:hypothetical protein
MGAGGIAVVSTTAVVETTAVGSAPVASVASGDAGAGLHAARRTIQTMRNEDTRPGEARTGVFVSLILFLISDKIELQ